VAGRVKTDVSVFVQVLSKTSHVVTGHLVVSNETKKSSHPLLKSVVLPNPTDLSYVNDDSSSVLADNCP